MTPRNGAQTNDKRAALIECIYAVKTKAFSLIVWLRTNRLNFGRRFAAAAAVD